MTEALMVLPGNNDGEKLVSLCNLTYKEQIVWWLNAFWNEGASEAAEQLWQYNIQCADIDIQNHAAGCALDEMQAHVFLEKFNETLTVRDMRTKLRETGAIGQNERPKVVPITHYLLFKYNQDWHRLVNASQGDNSKEIAEATAMLREVQVAFEESAARASEAAQALMHAQSTENSAKNAENEAVAREQTALEREAEAREREAPFKAAQEEVEAALAEVHKQEEEYQGKIDDCKRRSEEGGVVQRNKAKNELAQLQAEDPLPLRKAKITLEAAYKRAEKTRAPFEAATKEAEAARAAASAAREEASARRAEAEAARKKSEAAKEAAEEAMERARQKVQEAEDFLEEVKSRPGSGGQGALWWLDRELHEQKKYLPEAKGGIRK